MPLSTPFFLWSYILFFVLCFFFLLELHYLLSLSLMVGYYDIRCISPSVAFFFARLGVFLGSSSDHYPRVGDFFLSDSGLGLVLGNLCPLLCQSLYWFGCV